MCGIFCFIQKCGNNANFKDVELVKRSFDRLKVRGPDNTTYYRLHSNLSDTDLHIGFHRLSINDVTEAGNQPFITEGKYIICNGEIYNFALIAEELEFDLKSRSDCEGISPSL